MARTNQGGSILSFLVIGGVLVFLLIGGAYIVRRNTSVVANQPQPVAEQTDDENDDTPAAEEPEQPEGADTTETDEEPASSDEDEFASSDEVAGTAPDSLPETGIEDIFLGGIMLGAAAAAGVMYWRSRQDAIPL